MMALRDNPLERPASKNRSVRLLKDLALIFNFLRREVALGALQEFPKSLPNSWMRKNFSPTTLNTSSQSFRTWEKSLCSA